MPSPFNKLSCGAGCSALLVLLSVAGGCLGPADDAEAFASAAPYDDDAELGGGVSALTETLEACLERLCPASMGPEGQGRCKYARFAECDALARAVPVVPPAPTPVLAPSTISAGVISRTDGRSLSPVRELLRNRTGSIPDKVRPRLRCPGRSLTPSTQGCLDDFSIQN
jgi:hypothetical protein